MAPDEYSLAPYCEVLELEGVLHVGFGSAGVKFEDGGDKAFLYRLLANVSKTREIADTFLATKFEPREHEILELLRRNNLIVPRSAVPQYNRNHRDHLFYLMAGGIPSDVQALLKNKTVCIIGCGGIGCIVSYVLATAGVKRLILMDDDVVEIHNITRQFAYTENDIGKKKVYRLEQELRERNSELEVEAHDCRAWFSDLGSNAPRCDFVVLAADERGLKPRANEYFVKVGQPFIHISYINDIAVWGPLVVPGLTGCLNCQTHVGAEFVPGDSDKTSILKAINATYICPVISPISLIASSFAALDIIKWLAGIASPVAWNRRVGMWTNDMKVEYQDYSRTPVCTVCKDAVR